MTRSWKGPLRAVSALVIGGGLVVAAGQVPGTLSLGGSLDAVASTSPQLVPVTSASLSCPGPETEGMPNIPATPGTSTVLAAAAPAEALTGVTLGRGAGTVAVTATPSSQALGHATARGAILSSPLTGATAADVTASGSLAPALGALQTWLQPAGDDRALVSTPCRAPQADVWLVGGAGDSTRRERITVTNPGANAVSVDVSVHGAAGALASASGKDVAVPPHGRVTLLLDALVGLEKTPVVHVVASGGVVSAVLEDSWIDGAVGRGADDAAPAADPSLDQVIPAAYVDGPARLRIAVPGGDEAVVQARILTGAGPVPLPGGGVVRVPGGAVRELDMSTLPPGAYAVQVRADHPVIAGAMIERRGDGKGQSDFGWTTSTAPIPVVAGVPLPAQSAGSLMLVATGDAAAATVVTVSDQGVVASKDVAVGADSTAVVDVTGTSQVWVRRTSGVLRAGLSLSLTDKTGATPLFSLVPLGPLAVSATQMPVRQVSG